jgi:hypothetical protein
VSAKKCDAKVMPAVPFRVFGLARYPWVLPHQGCPLRISYSLRVVVPHGTAHMG